MKAGSVVGAARQRGTALRVVGGLFAAGAILAAAIGCATGAKAPPPPDRTGDLTLEMYEDDEGGRYARYLVDRDGTLSFGGGLDAMAGDYSWSGPLTDEEIAQLLALLERNHWMEADPPAGGASDGVVYHVTLRRADVRRAFTTGGDAPGVQAVHELLDTAARRRFSEFLEELPQPGERGSGAL